MNCAYWMKIGIKNCGKQLIVKFKHEQTNMKGKKIEKILICQVFLKSGLKSKKKIVLKISIL